MLKKVTVHSILYCGHTDVQPLVIVHHPRYSVHLQISSAIIGKPTSITGADIVFGVIFNDNLNKISLKCAARGVARGVERIVSNEVINPSYVLDVGRWVGLAC